MTPSIRKESRHWQLTPASQEPHYIPDAQEIAEMQEVEELQRVCSHPNINSEDGCPDCGYDAK